MRVLVAMSGGVDSSVAAALLVAEGRDVVGVTLKQWDGPAAAGCCTVADAEDARRVAAVLGIPFYVLDYREAFETAVVEPFVEAYLAGRTPNPCVTCNRVVRFGALAERARELGCEALATGHHARVVDGPDGPRLLRGRDRAKDQSYVLHTLRRDQLRGVRFPVGELTKAEVRRRAAELGLRVADKPDSQDLCFLVGDPRAYLRRVRPDAIRPGPVVDVEGRVVGRHEGAVGFTVGQRRGLGVAAGERRYVVAVDVPRATVVVGRRRDLLADGCEVAEMSFVGEPPDDPRVEVQLRYRARPVPAVVRPSGEDRWEVDFDVPQEAVAPGQAAVLYRGDEVLGGGTIVAALRR